MITFYHSPETRSGRTMWLMEESGLPFETRYVTIEHMDGRGAIDPANIHPDGRVPAIVHDGVVISESYAIAVYVSDLAANSGLGAPEGSAERGPFLAWLMWLATEMEPVIFGRLYGGGGGDPRAERNYQQVIRRLETALANGPYLMGDRFTAVDVMAGSTIAWARHAFPESAAIDAWLARIADRPAHQQACANDAELVDA
ncbi:glutathione S-transferase family protein [Sphingomonas koreensis]|uniref:glutathione S-transferase family protein n=1 Tax=Sphingomonas koreensis TaxID=93064 RepID=UPI00082BCC4C|nr:glutathione S-transferase family protein [Sphingomonas koreensis]PJI87514.1 glutathione S-transferase [Sphingomonas koreensis]RSU62898.1 glutathione S-transferase family protein [Sphingomonas koreensis]RSU71608.1 glutathione S-transferase family protein [Sphingomonas koreensis]